MNPRGIIPAEPARYRGFALEELLTASLIFIAVAAAWRFRYFNKLFVIKIKPGKAELVKGSPPPKYLEDCRKIVRRNRIYGVVCGAENEQGVILQFSRGITEDFRQRFRNVFPYELYERKPFLGDTNTPKAGRK